MSLSLSQSQIFEAFVIVLGGYNFVSSVPGASVPIVQGQQNRVPEAQSPDFIEFWPIRRERIGFNLDYATDNQLTASITNRVLTVSEVLKGQVGIGLPLYGSTVTPGCIIVAQLSGTPNGAGTYSTRPTLDVSETTLYCGQVSVTESVEFVVQTDVHGPLAGDNAQRIAMLWFDQWTVSAFEETDVDVSPLYASEPRQLPFLNAEQQIEERWSIDLHMQANIKFTTTMQFASQIQAGLDPVDVLQGKLT